MDGYFAIQDFKGESIGLHFGLPAFRDFTSELEDNRHFINKKGGFTEVGIAYLVFFGYQNWCIMERLPEKFVYKDFLVWVEDLFLDADGVKLLGEIAICYSNSKYTKKKAVEKEEEDEDESKKNLTGTTSSPSSTESLDVPVLTS